MDIVWHRKDLRLRDNMAVSKSDDTLPVFIFDNKIMKKAGARRTEWLLRNLRSLRTEYRSEGSDVRIEFGKPWNILPQIVDNLDVDGVHWNRMYTPLARRYEDKVYESLSNEVECDRYYDDTLHNPKEIYTNKGDPYSVFTYYHKKWKKKEKNDPYRPNSLNQFTDSTSIPSLTDLPVQDDVSVSMPEPGTDVAEKRLEEFCSNGVDTYGDDRDYPDRNGTSRLSAYRSYGVIGPRRVWKETENCNDDAEDFQEQLAWSDFYTQVLYHNPHVVSENYKSYENPIEWEDDDRLLEKWKNGMTGYPIVDAGMRQLIDEGYMHNRLRMIVASFLTKDLLIDWRHGYRWFRQMLIDHDAANNNGGWQWAASTGTDAQPYFRIFNPTTQGERYDPDATYIKKYVTELSDLSADTIHSWTDYTDERRSKIDTDYPSPIVDHSSRREQALDMFKSARGENDN